jgi:hypothetical protein
MLAATPSGRKRHEAMAMRAQKMALGHLRKVAARMGLPLRLVLVRILNLDSVKICFA